MLDFKLDILYNSIKQTRFKILEVLTSYVLQGLELIFWQKFSNYMYRKFARLVGASII